MKHAITYPFRLFANNNLGTHFDYTYLTGEWLPSKGTGQCAVLPEINLSTGNLILKSTHVKTQEQIGNWEFGFVYNAHNKQAWSYNISRINASNASQLSFSEEDGSAVTYYWDAIKTAFIAPSGSESKSCITKQTDNTWIKYDPKTGARSYYDSSGNITDVYDARGFSMHYEYDANEKLQSISSDAGIYTLIEDNSTLSISFMKTGEQVSNILGIWHFDSYSRLQNVVIPDANNYTITYFYSGISNQLTAIKQTDGTCISFSYTQNQVTQFQQGTRGPEYNFNYTGDITTVTDAMGSAITATLDESGRLLEWEQETHTTSCNYNENGDLTRLIKPNGSSINWTFNSAGLIEQTINANGQTTQCDYDSETGARIIKRELINKKNKSEQWAVTRYVYCNTSKKNTPSFRNLVFLISPSGCVTEYRYNNENQLTSERIYLKNKYDVSAIEATTALQLKDMTAWISTQPIDSIQLTTVCQNNRGQLLQREKFDTINADGTGKNTLGASNEQYPQYARWGAVEISIEKKDGDTTATTQKTFDGLGRLTSHQNALNQTRQIIYHDAQNNSVITEPNGRTETRSWNDSGQEISNTTAIKASSTTRVKKKYYDAAGRLSSVTDIDGQTTYFIFNALNQLRFIITPMGRVTDYFYDVINRYNSITHYFNPIDISTLALPLTEALLQKNIIPDLNADVITYKSYDASERLQFNVDGRGAVIEHRYDLQNRETTLITYATPLSPSELSALKTGFFSRTPALTDIISTTYYDNDDHIIATQDAMGYVTQHERNAAGFEQLKTQFSTPIPLNLTDMPIYPAATADDFIQFYYCDARGRECYRVDATSGSNYLLQKIYYPSELVATQIHYANKVTEKPTLTTDPATLVPSNNSEDQIIVNNYDLLSRLIEQHLPQMRLRSQVYDEMGNCIQINNGDDPTKFPEYAVITTQTSEKQFDDWGQLSAEAPMLVYEKIQRIKNNVALTKTEQQIQIAAVWKNNALRYQYNDAGLHTAKIDITPDNTDQNNSSITYFYYDADQRLTLTVGAEGQASAIIWHPVFTQPLQKYRYATPLNTQNLTGGFISPEINGLLISTQADLIEQYTYDGAGAQNSYTDGDGFLTKIQTNMFGLWDQKIIPIDSTTPTLIINREFNSRLQCTLEEKITGAKSITSKKMYNNLHGHCTSLTDANNSTSFFTYEPRGVLETTTDALSRTTTVSHDAFERVVLQNNPLQNSVQFIFSQKTRTKTTYNLDNSDTIITSSYETYDAFNNVIEKCDAENNSTIFLYNLANQLSLTIDPLGTIHTKIYDIRGLLMQTQYTSAEYKTASQFNYTRNKALAYEISDAGILNLKTTHAWNALSQRYQTVTPSGYLRLIDFNGRGLATAHHACLSSTTAIASTPSVVIAKNYNGQQRTNAVNCFSTNGVDGVYAEKILCDGFGRATTRVVDPNQLKLTHQRVFDNADRVIATIDPMNNTIFTVHDRVGNIRFRINPKGGVIEYRYNDANMPIFKAQYKKSVDLIKIIAGMEPDAVAALITQTANDHHTFYFYDALMNERFTLDRKGCVTETRYNKNSKKIAVLRYYTAIDNDPTQLTTSNLIAICALIRNKQIDEGSFCVFDSNGQERFIINAEGLVIEKQYYAISNFVSVEIHYSAKITDPDIISQLPENAISARLTITPSNDRITYRIPDGIGRLRFHVNSKGAVTRYDYDGDTKNYLQITEFNSPIVMPAADYATLLTTLNALIPDIKIDSIETRTYDQAEREITRTNALGYSESWEYDGANRKSQHTTLSGHTWEYTYDAANRLLTECSPTVDVYSSSINPLNPTEIIVTKKTTSVEKNVAHDANDNPTCIISGVNLPDESSIQFEFDSLNKKSKDTWCNLPIDDITQKTNLTMRPETLQSVSRVTLYGLFGEKLITRDETGAPHFFIYDTQGHIQFEVNAAGYVVGYQRNALGFSEITTQYANPLLIDLNNYVSMGLTADIIINALIPDPNQDSNIFETFNRCGKRVQMQRNAIISYIPNINPTLAPSITYASPTTIFTLNAFSEEIAKAVLLDSTTNNYRVTQVWRDQLGEEIATLDANGIAIITTRDCRGKSLGTYHYAKSLSKSLIPSIETDYAEFTALLTPLADTTKDHVIQTPRDISGNQVGVFHLNAVTQSIINADFSDNPTQTLSQHYTLTADGKIKSVTYPNSQSEIFYYDARRNLIAKAHVSKTQTAPDGTTKIIRPITYYQISAHGDHIAVYQPAGGCDINLDLAAEIPPMPISINTQDRLYTLLRDAKRQVLAKQNPNNYLQQLTYTVAGKVARNYGATTNGNPTANNEREIHLDETRFIYDALHRVIFQTQYRDLTAVSGGTLAYQYNGFALIAEGLGDGTWPVHHNYNQAGHRWSTFNSIGGAQLIGHNLAGEETVRIESLSIDLSTISYADLIPLMQNRETLTNNITNYEFTETLRDANGRTIGLVEPGYIDTTIIRPLHQIAWNAFNKKTRTVTPAGDVTLYEHNLQNKLSQQTDPAISVVDEHGNTSSISAVTTLGYDAMARKIGMRDANNHTELFYRDEAGDIVTHTAGDGTPYYTKTRTVFRQAISITSASGNTWKKTYTSTGATTQIITPLGETWNYSLNEHDFVIQVTKPTGSATGTIYYAQDVFGALSARYLPMGEAHLFTNDHHRSTLSHTAINSDGTTAYTVSTPRDFWSRITDKTDGAGSTYHYTYFLSGVPYQELGVSLIGHGNMVAFDSTTNTYTQNFIPTPLQNITRTYLTSLRENALIDANTARPQILTRVFDINRNPILITEKNGAGTLLRNTETTFNARNWPLSQTDINHFLLNYYYDPIGNRRRMIGSYQSITRDAWCTYDNANRVLVNEGALCSDTVIRPAYAAEWGYLPPTQGNAFAYVNGFRNAQWLTILQGLGSYDYSTPLTAALGRDGNDRINTIIAAPQVDFSAFGATTNVPTIPAPQSVSDQSIMQIGLNTIFEPHRAFVSRWIPGQNASNTTALAISGNQFVLPKQLSIAPGHYALAFFGMRIPRQNAYLAVMCVNVNDTICQGFTAIPDSTVNSFCYSQNLQYTSDGLFSQSTVPLNNANQLILNRCLYNLNGAPINFFSATIQEQSTTAFSNTGSLPAFNVDGNANYSQAITSTAVSVGYPPTSLSVTDCSIFSYLLFDTTMIAGIAASRTNQYGTHNRTVIYCYDANAAITAIQGIAYAHNTSDPTGTLGYNLFFDNSVTGALLLESLVLFNNGITVYPKTALFLDYRNRVVAEYGQLWNHNQDAPQSETALQLTANPVSAFTVSNVIAQSQSVVVQKNDTWMSISNRLFGESSYASILRAHSGTSLIPGQLISADSVIQNYNNVMNYTPYEKLLNAIYSTVSPALATPQPPPPPPHHESFWDEVIDTAVSLVTMTVGMIIAGPCGLGMPTLLAGAFAGMLSDTASQAVAIALGNQQNFSVSDLLENAATCAITQGLGAKFNVAQMITNGKYLEAITASSTICATTQLFEMAAGLRKSFDLKLIIEQVSAQIVSVKLEDKLKSNHGYVNNGIDGLTSAVASSAFGYPINYANLAGNFLGDEASDSADVLAKKAVLPQPSSYPSNPKPPSQFSGGSHLPTPIQTDRDAPYDPHTDLNSAYERTLSRGLESMSAASVFSLNNSESNALTQSQAMHMQREAKNTPWETRLSETINENQAGPFARTIMGFASLMNANATQFFVHTLNAATRDAMTSFAGDYGTHYFDDLQNGTSTFSDAFGFTGADVAMQMIGEASGHLVGEMSSIAKSWGSLFANRATSFHSQAIETGGRLLNTALESNKADNEALQFYKKIRAIHSNDDVHAISKNTGMPAFKIQRIKQHLFFERHALSTGLERFAPDIEISDAWTRLQNGGFTHQDLNLLQHEYFESRFEHIYKTDYITAHNAANNSERIWNPDEFSTTPAAIRRP